MKFTKIVAVNKVSKLEGTELDYQLEITGSRENLEAVFSHLVQHQFIKLESVKRIEIDTEEEKRKQEKINNTLHKYEVISKIVQGLGIDDYDLCL